MTIMPLNDAFRGAQSVPSPDIPAVPANDQALLDAIGHEYDQGRLLLIGTTDLDAQRPVIWNIGALAASHHPQALDLFRKILRALLIILALWYLATNRWGVNRLLLPGVTEVSD